MTTVENQAMQEQKAITRNAGVLGTVYALWMTMQQAHGTPRPSPAMAIACWCGLPVDETFAALKQLEASGHVVRVVMHTRREGTRRVAKLVGWRPACEQHRKSDV